jgi:hypothetical protein
VHLWEFVLELNRQTKFSIRKRIAAAEFQIDAHAVTEVISAFYHASFIGACLLYPHTRCQITRFENDDGCNTPNGNEKAHILNNIVVRKI